VDLERRDHRSQTAVTARRGPRRPWSSRLGGALLIAVVVLTLAAQVLLARTFVLLSDEDELFNDTESLTVVANAQRQALALQNTLEQIDPDLAQFDIRLGLLQQQTRVMLINTPSGAASAHMLRDVRSRLGRLATLNAEIKLDTTRRRALFAEARAESRGLERNIKRIYDIEERRIFASVKADAESKRQSQLIVLGISGLTVFVATGFVFSQRRRARTSLEAAYRSLVQEVADRERAEADRLRAETQFSVGFDQSATGTVIADLEGRPLKVNDAICRFLGRGEEELLGVTWEALTHPDDVALGAAVLRSASEGEDSYRDERRYVKPDGSTVWALATVTLVRAPDGTPSYFFAQFQDITDRKSMEVELRRRALHDELTGLPNRTLFTDRLSHALATSRRRQSATGVIFLDLDNFKRVNDALGHAAGDLLLGSVAARLAGTMRESDTVARLGGDEFVVLCEDVDKVQLRTVARRIVECLAPPFRLDDREVHVTASLGVVCAGPDHTAEGLLRDADVAMYKAKEHGRGLVQHFDEQMREEAAARLDAETALRRAVETGEFCVHYQPIVSVATGVPVGAEALVRWDDPSRGLVSPADFIPMAEETGLIVPLGQWVLEEACRQIATWRRELPGAERYFVAVNLSARQLEVEGLVDVVRDAIESSGLPAAALHLEVTESVVMENVERSIEVLGALRNLGIRLAIDDFGTGYSSLSYLQRLPVDTLKIDRSFVRGLGVDGNDTSIAKAVATLGHSLDLNLVAEGVETDHQWAHLQEMDCDFAQGYRWSPPLDPDDFVAWRAGLPGQTQQLTR
jgi:diguanylate cyclase (GGDEF)-like protein/PAS domain S-box-containing protein